MCYASPVMLRGRRSCAILDRPTPSFNLRLLVTRHCSRNSFVSPTSKKNVRKCFVSPTYAKTVGWGGVIRMVTYLQNAGAPTFLFRARRLRIVAKADGHLKVAA